MCLILNYAFHFTRFLIFNVLNNYKYYINSTVVQVAFTDLD